MFYQKIIRRLLKAISYVRSQMRILGWNLRPQVHVSKSAFIADGAKLQIDAPGLWPGGSLEIANGVHIMEGVILSPSGGNIQIEDNVWVGPYTVAAGHGGLKIGKNTLIAGHTYIIPANHIFQDPNQTIASQGETRLGITIEENVWIGCGVQILDGVTIGTGAVVAAGSVVNRDVPAYEVWGGVPSRFIKKRGKGLELRQVA